MTAHLAAPRLSAMTDASGSGTQGTQTWDVHNVIAVSFEDDGNAYNAMTSLKQLDAQQRIVVGEAIVVVRGEDGQLVMKDRVESNAMAGAAGGGLLGLLIGVIGGPLGVLVGGAYGLFVGSLFDLHEIDETDSALGAVSTSVRFDRTALLAVVDEQSPEVLDVAMANLGGTVVRRPVADVEAEIAAAEKAERTAKTEARKELVRGRHERDKAAVHAKVEELTGKLRGARHARSAGTDQAAERQPADAGH
jgi:uncharacterized membrane protein